jgi:hypothetical protein
MPEPTILDVLQSLRQQQQALEDQMALRESLESSDLPAQRFAGQPYDETAVSTAITEASRQYLPSGGNGEVHLPGQERCVSIGADAHEKRCAALDGFWAGQDLETKSGVKVPRFTSLQEAYVEITHQRWDPISCMEALHTRYDSHGRYGQRAAHFTEALATTSWGQIMGDSITRRMLAEYALPDKQTWRLIVSDIGTITDFRTQRRLRFGGYGTLPVVPEGISYTPLPSPDDQEASYAVSKRGGLESLTLEALANDAATGAVRRIPERLGRAAAETLYRAVFNLFDQNLPLAWNDDTTALFTTGHNNLVTPASVLNADGLDVMVQKLAQQTAYGNDVEFLGLRPKYLLHPTALWRAAAKLTETSQGEPFTADNDLNPFLRFKIQPIEVPYWTSATAFYLTCDPRQCPTIEVGFFRGREDPEVFVADAENVDGGSMWSADRMSWKIRFIFGVGVTEYRGMVANRS